MLLSYTSPSLTQLCFKIQNNVMRSNQHNPLLKSNHKSLDAALHLILITFVEYLYVEKAAEQQQKKFLRQITLLSPSACDCDQQTTVQLIVVSPTFIESKDKKE